MSPFRAKREKKFVGILVNICPRAIYMTPKKIGQFKDIKRDLFSKQHMHNLIRGDARYYQTSKYPNKPTYAIS